MAFLFLSVPDTLEKGLYTECWGTLKNIFSYIFRLHSLQSQTFVANPS